MPRRCVAGWRAKKASSGVFPRQARAGWPSRLRRRSPTPRSCLSCATAVTAISRRASSLRDARHAETPLDPEILDVLALGQGIDDPLRLAPTATAPGLAIGAAVFHGRAAFLRFRQAPAPGGVAAGRQSEVFGGQAVIGDLGFDVGDDVLRFLRL